MTGWDFCLYTLWSENDWSIRWYDKETCQWRWIYFLCRVCLVNLTSTVLCCVCLVNLTSTVLCCVCLVNLNINCFVSCFSGSAGEARQARDRGPQELQSTEQEPPTHYSPGPGYKGHQTSRVWQDHPHHAQESQNWRVPYRGWELLRPLRMADYNPNKVSLMKICL